MQISLIPENEISNEDIQQPQQKKTKNVKESIRKKNKRYEMLTLRTTPQQLINAIESMNTLQQEALIDAGLGKVLSYNIKSVPSRLAYWIVCNFLGPACTIKFEDGQRIVISKKDVITYLGLPDGDIPIEFTTKALQHPLVEEFRRQFKEKVDKKSGKGVLRPFSEIYPSDVVALLKNSKVADDNFIRNFMVLFWTLIVDGNSNGYVNGKILSLLENTSVIKQWNWGKYIRTSLANHVNEWKGTWFFGPILLPLLVYVDRVVINGVYSPRKLPIISNWDTNKLSTRENEEIKIGGFGKGYIREEVVIEEIESSNDKSRSDESATN